MKCISAEWKSADEAVAWRKQFFGRLFPAQNIPAESYDSPHMLSQFAFAGAGCLHTRKVTKDLPFLPEEAEYVSDCLEMGNFEVRDGFQRYGAAAYFDKDQRILGIYTVQNGEYIEAPNIMTPEWKHATMVWKNTMLAQVTIVDHMGKVHLMEANTLVKATRSHLSRTHPFRALCKLFTFRTITINMNAFKNLYSHKGFIERIWAFEGDEVQNLIAGFKDDYKFCTLPENIPKCMQDVENYPVNKDIPRFWKVMRDFVHDYLMEIYLHNPQNLWDDKEMQSCLQEIAEGLNLNKETDLASFDQVVDLFASLFSTATGFHEHVGHMVDYWARPDVAGTTLREGKEIDSIQTYSMLSALACATGMRTPKLIGNWEHLLSRDMFATKTIPVLRKFQRELIQLSEQIDRENKDRTFQLQSFNPRVMECSVSL